LPIPFNDFTVSSTDPKTGEEVTHVIGGKSTEGIKLSAVEMPAPAKSAPSLEKILADFSAKPGSKVADVQRAAQSDVDTLSFSVSGAKTSVHIRYIKTKSAAYSLTVEFPNSHRDDVVGIRQEFFGSFKTNAIGRKKTGERAAKGFASRASYGQLRISPFLRLRDSCQKASVLASVRTECPRLSQVPRIPDVQATPRSLHSCQLLSLGSCDGRVQWWIHFLPITATSPPTWST
jgi:hypothetical protein